MNYFRHLEKSNFSIIAKGSIWLFGIPAWIFGMGSQLSSVFSLGGNPSILQVVRLLTLTLCLLGWFFLKPKDYSSFKEVVMVSSPLNE